MAEVFVHAAEAAFIAGVTDRDINRAVDEHILSEPLIRLSERRSFARLGAALAGFYFHSEDVYVAPLRRRVVAELVEKLNRRPDWEALLGLASVSRAVDWRVEVPSESLGAVEVDVTPFMEQAMTRIKTLDRAEELVTSDTEVMGGLPVFAGTRVPVDSVVGSLKKGISRKRIFDAYPSLTDEHLEVAKLYSDIRPRRGRPSKRTAAPESWKLKNRRRVSLRTPRA